MSDLKERLDAAMSSLDRMTDQRDQLSAQFKDATHQCGVMADVLREARQHINGGHGIKYGLEFRAMFERIDAALAGTLPAQHPDDAAVDRFATAMKAKLAAAREKGRGGWDDPEACSVEFLADLLVGHVGKVNPGNFEDIANLAMMLHQRGADPAILANADKIAHNTEKLIMGIDALFAGELPTQAVGVTETIRTAPERIWLQVGDQAHYHSEPFPRDTEEVTWCADSVVGCEVPYVRADLVGRSHAVPEG